MKKLILIILTILSIVSGQWAQNPDETVNNCIKALGGAKGIKNHRNFKAEGHLNLAFRSMKLSGKLITIIKGRKSWSRFRVKFSGATFEAFQAFDGKKAWMDRMNTIADQPALNSESELDHTIELLLEKNAKFNKGKATEIEGKKVIGIDVEFKGKKTTFYIDPKTFLPLEIVYTDEFFGQNNIKEKVNRRLRLKDYKKIDGLFFPMHQIIYKKGKKNMEMKYNSVKFNPVVEDSIFLRPDQAMDLRYREEILN